MISTILQNNFKKTIFKILKAIAVTAFWIAVWDAAALFMSRDNELMLLLLPRPVTVFQKWLEIGFTAEYLAAVGKTLLRILFGFLIGLGIGAAFGIITHTIKIADAVLSPMLKVIRAVPVAAITILFFSIFKSDSLPVLIVALTVIPLVWQTVHDGLSMPQPELYEMARLFKLGFVKTFIYIKLPALLPSFITISVNALGFAWKSGVAAEVICEPDVALGTMLTQGKGMIDFSTVYAVTLTVVILSLIIELVLKTVSQRVLIKGRADK